MAGEAIPRGASLRGMFRAYAATLSGDVPGTLFRHFFVKGLKLKRFRPRFLMRRRGIKGIGSGPPSGQPVPIQLGGPALCRLR